MRSKAHFKSHPIHPALVPFPFAFLTGSLLFDIAGVTLGRPALWTTGAHLAIAGIGAGLLAAVPGVVDYLQAVPPGSSGQSRARRHGLLNVLALTLFAVALFLRSGTAQPTWLSLGAAALGAAALAYAGVLGGTLVTRNLISVDHRYADAGKWREERFEARSGQPLTVADADTLKVDQMMLLRVNGVRIVLARTPDGYRAFDDGCTHKGGSLAGGAMIGGTVQCLWHGSQFDTASGDVVCGPAKKKIRVYETRVIDGRVVLTAPPDPR